MWKKSISELHLIKDQEDGKGIGEGRKWFFKIIFLI